MTNIVQFRDWRGTGAEENAADAPSGVSIQDSIDSLSLVIGALLKLRRCVPGCDPGELLAEAQALRDELELLDLDAPSAIEDMAILKLRILCLRDAVQAWRGTLA